MPKITIIVFALSILSATLPSASASGSAPAQTFTRTRAGVSVSRDTTLPSPLGILAPPSAKRFQLTATYIGALSAFGAVTFMAESSHGDDRLF